MLSSEEIKKATGIHAAGLVRQGMTIGLGTGSTVYWLIQELGDRASRGLKIKAVPTSQQTALLARKAGIQLADLHSIEQLALTIDGADQIDPLGQLIKGGGGALLQEKIVASASAEVVIIADSGKLVDRLGSFPLPVEVIPFGYKQVWKRVMDTGLCKSISLRQKNDRPFITDHHNYILDCHFEVIEDAIALNRFLHDIAGVVETGIFLHLASRAIIGHPDGRIENIKYKK